MRTALLLPVAAVAVACGGGHSTGATVTATDHTMTGSFSVARGATDAGGCHATATHSDIATGTTLTVKNDVGRVIATTELGQGAPSPTESLVCAFPFTAQVPDSPFYVIAVAGHENTISRADMEKKHWQVDIGLGGL